MSRIIKKYISLLCGTLHSVTGYICHWTSFAYVGRNWGELNHRAEFLVLRAFVAYIFYRVGT